MDQYANYSIQVKKYKNKKGWRNRRLFSSPFFCNNEILKKSLIVAAIIIIPIVFFMGFSGLVAVSVDPKVIPDLGFFSLLLKEFLI